jgi:acyl carrier protein
MSDTELALNHLVQKELGLHHQLLTRHTRLVDLGDSLDAVTLLAAVEDRFGLRIGAEQTAQLHTLGDLLNLIEEPSLA